MAAVGTMSMAHLAWHLAWQPGSLGVDQLQVPETPTFLQMVHLDEEVEALNQCRWSALAGQAKDFQLIDIKIGSLTLPVHISVSKMRKALGLPEMNLNGLASFGNVRVDGPMEDMGT
jgi:hypothetical protein